MTPEQKQRIEQIQKKREQQRNRPMLAVEGVAWDDVDFLLSLVKGQEAGDGVIREHHCANPNCIDGKVSIGCAVDAPLITIDCPECSAGRTDQTRFIERGFTVVENAGHSLRLIDRDDARYAISIKWADLPALRELITLALNDQSDTPSDLLAFKWAETLSAGEQSALLAGSIKRLQGAINAMIDNVATSMRSACVEKVREYLTDCRDEERGIIEAIANELESLSIEKPKE